MKARAYFKILIVHTLFSFLFYCVAWASDDFQYWSRVTLKTWEQGPWSLSTYGDLRLMKDASDPRLYLISERLGYRRLENLDLGLNYTYLESETTLASGQDKFKYQHRLELEVSPGWSVDDWLKVKNRNRMEFRWIEGQGSDNARFRQLWELSFPLKDKWPFKAFYVNDEYFFDFNRSQINENRLIPAGIEFKVNDKTSLKVFYMV